MTPEQIMKSAELPIPDQLYRGAGKCWVAISNSRIVGLVYMGSMPLPTLADIGRKRYTREAAKALRAAEWKAFTAFREESRRSLGMLGEVVSGMASGGAFYPKSAEAMARAAAIK